MELLNTVIIITATRGYYFQDDRVFYSVAWKWVSDEPNPEHEIMIHIRRGELGPFQQFNWEYNTRLIPSTEKSMLLLMECKKKCLTETFVTGKNTQNHEFIKCLKCGFSSFYSEDIKYKYCGKCKMFHYDIVNQIPC